MTVEGREVEPSEEAVAKAARAICEGRSDDWTIPDDRINAELDARAALEAVDFGAALGERDRMRETARLKLERLKIADGVIAGLENDLRALREAAEKVVGSWASGGLYGRDLYERIQDLTDALDATTPPSARPRRR